MLLSNCDVFFESDLALLVGLQVLSSKREEEEFLTRFFWLGMKA